MRLTDWIQALSAVAIVGLTAVLVWLTRKYAGANERMAEALEKDFAERYRPSPQVECEIVHRDDWLYSLEARIMNKGLAPLRLDAVRVTVGQRVLREEEQLILAVGETRGLQSLRFSLHDLALGHLEEGHPVTIDFTVMYRELDGAVRHIVRQPMVEYRARPIPRR